MLSFFTNNKALATTITPPTAAATAAVVSIGDKRNTHSEQTDGVQKILAEMERRNDPFYVLGRWIGKLIGTVNDDQPSFTAASVTKVKREKAPRQIAPPQANVSVSFQDVYQNLFPQDTLRVLYMELDPGVDDGAALMQLLATRANGSRLENGKGLEVVGIVPCVGNAILPQTLLNTMQFLTLTDNEDIKVYPGAIAPLAIANNQTDIQEMNTGINATHFYGYDGESDVGGWPKVTMSPESKRGYKFAAEQIYKATPETAITLVSTSALTELSKTLTELEKMDSEQHLPPGSFAKNINAISIMGGCISQTAGCNAPFNVSDNEKNSEANFYFDTPAAQNVFAVCQKYGISILLAPLDLTQQPGLLWGKQQDATLNQANNPPSSQMARATGVVPYLDVPCFPNGTYPMHDLQAMTDLLYPEFYNVTRFAFNIGNVGQMTVNNTASDAEKNVYVLSMPLEKQAEFYQKVLPVYKNFSPKSKGLSALELALLISAGTAVCSLTAFTAVKTAQSCKKEPVYDEEDQRLEEDNIQSPNNRVN